MGKRPCVPNSFRLPYAPPHFPRCGEKKPEGLRWGEWGLPLPGASTTARPAAGEGGRRQGRGSDQGPSTRRHGRRAGGRRRCWRGGTRSGGGRTPPATWCAAASGAATAASATSTTTSSPSPKVTSFLSPGKIPISSFLTGREGGDLSV